MTNRPENLPLGARSRFLTNRYAIRLFFALAACSIGGCGEDTHEQIARIGGYEISIRTAPSPLALGEKAEITVKLTDTDRHPATGCRMRLRQYMPGMKMSLDNVYFPLNDAGNEGIYHGESGEFSMGGRWVVELEITCGNETHTQVFDYDLDW